LSVPVQVTDWKDSSQDDLHCVDGDIKPYSFSLTIVLITKRKTEIILFQHNSNIMALQCSDAVGWVREGHDSCKQSCLGTTQTFFVCPHPFVFPWAVESSPLQVLALA